MSVNIVHSDGSLEKIAGMGFGGGVPSGGTTGQVLAKKSNTDYDVEWKPTYHFDTMPSAADLIALDGDTVFETDGYYEKGDGAGGKYLISSTYTTNSKRVSSGGVTKYLLVLTDDGATTDVIDVVKFGLRPYRGALSGTLNPTDTYATANSAIMSALTTLSGGVTLRFGFGRFVFANPLVLTSTRINLKGAETPMSLAQTNANYVNGTVLCFPFLTDGQIAIDAIGGNMEDIMVYGSLGTYNISFDRTKTIEHPEQVITEVNNAECTGIHRTSGGHMRNVAVMGFYKGIDLETANWYLEDIYCQKCHFGLVIFRDTKCIGVYGKDVHTLATIKGSTSSIQQLRVDSCVHAVNVYGGHCVTLDDIDGDYCTDSLILLGNIENHAGELYNASFTGIHGRCCTLKAYAKADYPNGLDVRTLASTAGYGVISLDTNTKIYRSYFQLNSNGGREPIDGDTTHECPHIVLAFAGATATRIKDCIFSFPSEDIKTPDDVLKFFEGANGTPTFKVDTSNNTYYVEGNSVRVSSDRRYNVLDYGLKGDRTTDNTSALRSLISLIPNGSVIFFPVGTYMISEGIEVNKDVTFLGENQEMQIAGTAPNRLHDPMSIIKYGGNTANVTMFTRASGYYDINFVNLTLDGGDSYDVTDNWTATFTELPFYNQLETTNLAGINGLDLTVQSLGIVKNCMFWGFSGYGVKASTHKFIERCGFYKCKKGIETMGVDYLFHDLWFCKCGTAIYMTPKNNEHFASANISDIWADQLIDHVIEADATVTSAQIIADNLWIDSVGKSAFYLPDATLTNSHISGTFGRVGMDYAGIADADRTSGIASDTDFIACGRLTHSVLELNIANVAIGKGSNASGECFSRLITTYKSNVSQEYNKIICNKFPVSKLYDTNTQPQYSFFVNTDYDGTDGLISIYSNAKYTNGFCEYNRTPIGNYKAPSKNFIVYDKVNNKLYRSTAGDDNTAWEEIQVGILKIDTLPTATASRVGQTVLYMGATDFSAQKIHGAIYECVSDGATTPTYSWKAISIPMEGWKAIVLQCNDFADFKALIENF